jgi:hypothetical protein
LENNMEASWKTKHIFAIWSSNITPRIHPKECDSCYFKGTCTLMFIAARFTIKKLWISQDAPLLTNGLRKCGIYKQWSFTQPQRWMKFSYLQVSGNKPNFAYFQISQNLQVSKISQAQKVKNLMFALIYTL